MQSVVPRAINSRDRYPLRVTPQRQVRGAGVEPADTGFKARDLYRHKLPARRARAIAKTQSCPARGRTWNLPVQSRLRFRLRHGALEPLGFEPRYRLCKGRVLPVRRRSLKTNKARCRIRTDDSTMARSRDGPFTNRARKFTPTKNPENRLVGFGACCLFFKTFGRTLPAQTILLVAALRGVTARVCGGGVLGELVLCVQHGFMGDDEGAGEI